MVTELVATGLGVVSAIGQGREQFLRALLAGEHAFAVMERPGRQGAGAFLGAEIRQLALPDIDPRRLRTASLSTRAALAVLQEAWHEARLDALDPQRIGLVVGGSNFQQRELIQAHLEYQGRAQFLRPTYGLSFMDSDLCGFCTQHFPIHGLAYTAGGASASGQLALVLAAQAVQSGQVDACIALGALMDLSYWECQGLRAIGAMGSDRYASQPESACRPFDCDRDGFIFGEASGAIVIERRTSSLLRGMRPYAVLRGWGIAMDGNRNADPSLAGEMRAIRAALRCAGWNASDVDYVNPHGTGSPIGDVVELDALRDCGLAHAWLNATKSLTGHALSAAGIVEVIATLLQMRAGQLHPTRNLERPLDPALRWVGAGSREHALRNALTLSMGFGGINTALCWQRCQPDATAAAK